MAEELDFERCWLRGFSSGIEQVAGEEIRTAVMLGSEGLSSRSEREAVVEWTSRAMERLEALVDEEQRKQILTGCACRYPDGALQVVAEVYERTRDVDQAHGLLQEQFESLLRDSLKLDEELVQDVVSRGWGSAGVIDDSTIIATKIPKSGNLLEYMRESDPAKKRQFYCHCPRVRDALRLSVTISPTYCYCGAGFYKSIWEGILRQPIRVELLETVLRGDEVCRFAVYLPAEG
jgi:hypothetical protein